MVESFLQLGFNLIEFGKQYFPTHTMILTSHHYMMFIEITSYVGDILNFYIDNQFREKRYYIVLKKRKTYLRLSNLWGINQHYQNHHYWCFGEISVEVPN